MSGELVCTPESFVYLDYNATTPLAEEVIEQITCTMKECWGNPSSGHEIGKKAKKKICEARGKISNMLQTTPQNILFMSGGTEANNLVIYSAIKQYQRWCVVQNNKFSEKPHIITTNTEHDSIQLPLKKKNVDVTYLDVHDLVEDLCDAIRPTTCLVTIMMANNETGILFPITKISRLISAINKKRQKESLFKILMHSDIAQAIGKIPVSMPDLDYVDYLTIVGHKFYGPRIGALYVKELEHSADIHPMFYGGGQESGFRPGTENTPMIVGLGLACELVSEHIEEYASKMKTARDYLENKLRETFGQDVRINCIDECTASPSKPCSILLDDVQRNRLPNTTSISFNYEKVTGPEILKYCKVVQASVGAACHSSEGGNNSVLANFGVCSFHCARTLRLSTGRETSLVDIDKAVNDIKSSIDHIIKSKS